MITDLFSHKIHSSGDEWPDKLAELALLFAGFDGQLFDRSAIEERLLSISPRASYAARDPSKFRDEISAYPAYLGLYYLEQSDRGWIMRLSETAKTYLVREEPDVGAFLRLQLPLFQYPNAMGAKYHGGSNKVTIVPNARDRTLDFVRSGVCFSPVRLVALALRADSELRSVEFTEANVTIKEVFALANEPRVITRPLPRLATVVAALARARRGLISAPRRFESRFHTLRHTELFRVSEGTVSLREAVNDSDREQILVQFNAVCRIQSGFNGFASCDTAAHLVRAIESADWGRYFDGVRTLPADIIAALTNDNTLALSPYLSPEQVANQAVQATITYPFRERSDTLPAVPAYNRRHELADPELTRIKRQRRNLAHKELVEKMDSWLRGLGARPLENEHVDLMARIPRDGSFIFEMKSGGESILDQIRKGLSQLYEYRYRYRERIADPSTSLCLVLPEPPPLKWMEDYLCNDRGINVCWFNDDGSLMWPQVCNAHMSVLSRGNSE